MAALLKKRAFLEYGQLIQDPPQPPPKKLRLIKKPPVRSYAIDFISCLESCNSSNEIMQILLRIDTTELDKSDLTDALKMLTDHFKTEAESAVRVKILSLLGDIGQQFECDVVIIIEECMGLLKNEMSHKVLAQGINTILKLAKLIPDNVQLHQKLVETAKNYLKDTNHSVKCKCLEVIGVLAPSCGHNIDRKNILNLVTSYFTNEDARVRSQAFKTTINLHDKGFKLDPAIYTIVCDALNDDYEIVRQAVLKLIWVIGNAYPENIILLPDSEQELRLIDDAFGKICTGVTDLSMFVRTQAAKLLGSMSLVSPKFLNQTLDKKLMSNMRRKRTAHELAWENVTSGEWASGKKWADDAPRELIDADSINLMSSGACGAFVHGLEDEFLEVRSAAVESLCQLSLNNPHFANLSLDFLVDMFNDEIEDVRLKAIDSLRQISAHIVLRDDQIETILAALEDFSQEVREGLHRMLSACQMSTTPGLKMCVEKLLDNLKKYPQDKRSTFRCMQKMGEQHPELILPLVPQFLNIHPFFDMAEPDVENPQYICILILVLNAAKNFPTILPLLEPHTRKHYTYLRDTMPNLVPVLTFITNENNIEVKPTNVMESVNFLKTVVNGLGVTTHKMHTNLLLKAKEHLLRLSEMDQQVSGTAQFTALYIGAQILMLQIFKKGAWMNPTSLATQQSNNLKANIQSLLEHCLKLQHLFVGFSAKELCVIKQFRLRALAINLVHIVKGSNASALAPCHHFLSTVEDMQTEIENANLEPDEFTSAVFKELWILEEPRPGTVARILIPILTDTKLGPIPQPNINIPLSKGQLLKYL
ncbi:integrator complex subunit 4 isoform X2 [Onthophagus taurus]|uniref:integrator complex subunit 4 isoform X2 n=1 Tax=Onthophagus taurus TaxID=166361 RepID=UPI0039BDF2A0